MSEYPPKYNKAPINIPVMTEPSGVKAPGRLVPSYPKHDRIKDLEIRSEVLELRISMLEQLVNVQTEWNKRIKELEKIAHYHHTVDYGKETIEP